MNVENNVKLEDRYCTLCGPESPKNVRFPANFTQEDLNTAIFSARRMPDRRHFRLVECAKCGIVYSDPAGDPSMISRLYLEAVVNYDRQEQQIYDSYAPVLDVALKGVKGRNVFLEIGGGTGFMLRYGAERGFASQIEVEPSGDAERKFKPAGPKARFIRGIFEPGQVPAGSVSLACFFQVLDHIPDPGRFLKDVFDVVEKGGSAVAVTHNTRAFSAKLLGERSPIYDIEHTYLFSPGNLPDLFKKAGFARTETFPIANNYSLKYWLHMAPVPKPLKAVLQKLFAATGLGEVKIKLYAGNFAVVGYKE